MSESRFQFLEIGRVRRQVVTVEQQAPVAPYLRVRLAEIIGSYGAALGQFNRPAGLVLDADGSLYVADSLNHRVQKITPAGDVYGLGGPDLLVNPQGVAVDGARFIYIVEQGADRLRKFSQIGYLVFVLGGPKARVRRFACPTAICLDSYHQLYIADTNNDRVTCYSATGHWQTDYHGPRADLALSRPQGVAVDPQGRVYISDTLHHRILRLTPDGKLDAVIGQPGPEPGQLSEPRGLAIGPDGSLWVADAGNDRVQQFTPDGEIACCFPDERQRGVDLASPTSVAADGEGGVYVSDSLNHRIIRLSPAEGAG